MFEQILTLKDADRILRGLGLELSTADKVEFLHGLEVESEHVDTVGGDWATIGLIVLDHLAEDPGYYRKLKKAMREHYEAEAERAAWMEAHESGRSRWNPASRVSKPTVFSNKATRSKKSKKVYAPGQNPDGTYAVYVLSENYAGHVRGGMAKSWRVVADKLTFAEAIEILNKHLGFEAFTPPADEPPRHNPSVKLSPSALSALETYVTDPAHVEQDVLEDEGAIQASREILESLHGKTLTTPDGSDPERCWSWHARLSYGAESAAESGDYGAAKALNALASKCIDVLRG